MALSMGRTWVLRASRKACLFSADPINTLQTDADFSGATQERINERIDLSGGALANAYMLRGIITGGRLEIKPE